MIKHLVSHVINTTNFGGLTKIWEQTRGKSVQSADHLIIRRLFFIYIPFQNIPMVLGWCKLSKIPRRLCIVTVICTKWQEQEYYTSKIYHFKWMVMISTSIKHFPSCIINNYINNQITFFIKNP